ncbi:MAG: sigma-54-dependent Fis family transcriptional regulator, partial [Elusimicrobia bacterium]|nr:sigma-54-dependent Fis family transcriptional regulator [Elusimicrobiota bacterium]
LSRRAGHFAPVDCGAIPEHLMENEFFGHERGSYTGAEESTPGLFEFADGGSLFLDEVCEMPASLQVKLLRALQERQFRRVGSNDLRSADVRLIAATNRDMPQEVRAGRFREDLFYRLNVIMLRLPPLRERFGDIPLLVEHALPRISREMGRETVSVDPAAIEILSSYPWPGNVRELHNVLRKAVLLCEGDVLSDRDLPESLVSGAADRGGAQGFNEAKKRCLQTFERRYFEDLLDASKGNVRAAAEAAGLPLSNLYWYLKRHDIKPQAYRV